jgi:hypothetical protein
MSNGSAATKPTSGKQTIKAGPIEIVVDGGESLAAALAKNESFKDWNVALGSITAKASSGDGIELGSTAGKVKFQSQASVFGRYGLYTDPKQLIKDLAIADDLSDGFSLPQDDGFGFCVLRWGYDLQASAEGSLALAAPAKVTFGVDGSTEGVFAVVHHLDMKTGARDVLQSTLSNWRLPASIKKADDLELGTWVIAEVDGQIGVKLAASYGYDFNWVRELNIGDLSGDIGLKLNVAISVALGFVAAGKYAVVVSRESVEPDSVRLRIFKLRKKGWNFAFDGGVTVESSERLLPEDYKDFIQAVFGTHGLQVLKEIEQWTDPDQPLSTGLATLGTNELKGLLTRVTGIDAAVAYEAARKRLLELLDRWDALGPNVASAIWAHVPEKDALEKIHSIADQIVGANPDTVKALLGPYLENVAFFATPAGKWLESAAFGSVLDAVTGTHEFERLQKAATLTSEILSADGMVKDVLLKLQDEITKRLKLDQIEDAINKNDFTKLDAWLKAKLATLLGPIDNMQKLQKARLLMHTLVEKGPQFYEKAKKALNNTYAFSISAKYQLLTTSTALLDASFALAEKDAAERSKKHRVSNSGRRCSPITFSGSRMLRSTCRSIRAPLTRSSTLLPR